MSQRYRNLAQTAGVALAVVLVGIVYLLFGRGPAQPAGPSQELYAEGATLALHLDGDTTGERVVELAARDAAGRPLALGGARLSFHMRDMTMGQIETELDQVAAGRYQARGTFFTMAGTWQITATYALDQAQRAVRFELPIAAPGEISGLVNPLRSDGQAVLAGQRLYLANCATCHGPLGRGDGPASVGLNPRPPSFVDHMQPGKHTDGQVFSWIKNGYRPGSPMPAWGGRMTDDQIWQLVVFLRTFGTQPAAPAAQSNQPIPALPAPRPVVPNAPEPIPPGVLARGGTIMRSDGRGEPQPLTTLPQDTYAEYPAVSPDGSQVAFVVVIPQPITSTALLPAAALYVAPASGGPARQVLRAETLLGAPRWLPDGQRVLLPISGLTPDPKVPGDIGAAVLEVEIASGSQTTLLRNALDPTVSPDGKRLAYLSVSPDGFTQQLMLAALDGSGVRPLLADPAFQSFYAPRFTPDGTRVIVAAVGGPPTAQTAPPNGWLSWLEPPTAAAHGLPWDLWVVDVASGRPHLLAQLGEDLPLVSFTADDREIVVMAAGGVYRMNLDGSKLRRISPIGDHGGLDLFR